MNIDDSLVLQAHDQLVLVSRRFANELNAHRAKNAERVARELRALIEAPKEALVFPDIEANKGEP